MKRFGLVFGCLVFLASTFAAFGQAPACAATDYLCKITALNKAMQADPKDPENYYNLALAYQNSGRYAEAVDMYGKYVAMPGLDTKYLADGYNNRGLALQLLKRFDLAFSDFDKAATLVPASAKFVSNRGSANVDLGRKDAAIADFTRSISLDPKLTDSYLGRAHVYISLSRADEAVRDFTSAIALDPTDPESFYNRAHMLRQKGEYSKAIVDYDKYLSMMSGNATFLADGYLGRGLSHARLGNNEQAINDFSRAIEYDPKRAAAYSARALIYREQNKAALAEADEKAAASLAKPN